MDVILDFILKKFGSVIQFFYTLFGNNYTLAILVFTLLVQILLLPLAIKQQKNSIKQASLAPKIAAIRKKYAGRNDQATQQKMQQETLDLYQSENFNPAGGCLPLLVQLPVILLLYNVVQKPLTYVLQYDPAKIAAMKQMAIDAGATIRDEMNLANYIINHLDVFKGMELGLTPDFNLFGIDLTQAPIVGKTITNMWLLLIPAVTFVTLLLTQYITRKFTYQSPEVKEQQKSCSMKIMTWTMPLMSTYFAAVWPGTMGVYWIMRNIFQTLQQIILAKAMPVPQFTEEDYKAAERELLGKSKKKKSGKSADAENSDRPKVRSLHYIDEDDDEPYAVLPDYDEDSYKSNAEKANGKPVEADGASSDSEDADAANDVREVRPEGIVPAPIKEDKPKNN